MVEVATSRWMASRSGRTFSERRPRDDLGLHPLGHPAGGADPRLERSCSPPTPTSSHVRGGVSTNTASRSAVIPPPRRPPAGTAPGCRQEGHRRPEGGHDRRGGSGGTSEQRLDLGQVLLGQVHPRHQLHVAGTVANRSPDRKGHPEQVDPRRRPSWHQQHDSEAGCEGTAEVRLARGYEAADALQVIHRAAVEIKERRHTPMGNHAT